MKLSSHYYFSISLSFSLSLSDQFIPNYYKYYRDTADESTPIIIRDFLTRLNDLVKSHPGGFVAEGASPGAVDYLIWPWLERLGALKLLSPRELVYLTLGAHARGLRYLSCVCVCVCVCVYPSVCLFQVQLLQRTFTPAINDSRGFLVGFSWILIRGFSKKPSLQKLWREKANMQIS